MVTQNPCVMVTLRVRPRGMVTQNPCVMASAWYGNPKLVWYGNPNPCGIDRMVTLNPCGIDRMITTKRHCVVINFLFVMSLSGAID